MYSRTPGSKRPNPKNPCNLWRVFLWSNRPKPDLELLLNVFEYRWSLWVDRERRRGRRLRRVLSLIGTRIRSQKVPPSRRLILLVPKLRNRFDEGRALILSLLLLVQSNLLAYLTSYRFASSAISLWWSQEIRYALSVRKSTRRVVPTIVRAIFRGSKPRKAITITSMEVDLAGCILHRLGRETNLLLPEVPRPRR